MNVKLIKVCEKLLFTNDKITVRNFKKELEKQDIKIIHAITERIVAFLQSLPKNLALFQALEPTFDYILQDQLNLSEDEQRYVFLTQKLENKKHLEEYELVAATQMLINYPAMFTNKFLKKLQKQKEDIISKENLFPLIKYLGDLWYDYYDKKEYNYHIELKNGYIFITDIDTKNFKEMADDIMSLANYLIRTHNIENFEVDEEKVIFYIKRNR